MPHHPGHRAVGALMREWVERFFDDLYFARGWSVAQIFEWVENIPYQEDGGDEVVARPSRILELGVADCKKKSILIACWAKINGIPYRFLAVNDVDFSGMDGIRHVFCVVWLRGGWLSMDATIKGLYTPGSPMPVNYAEVV